MIPILIFLLLTIPAGCATAPQRPTLIPPGDYEYTRQYVSWLIEREMREHGVPGVSIALVDDQRLVWAQGFGSADVANEIPAAPETVYRIGSVSKLFTVTAAMQLAEQGRVDIDAPVRTYLSAFSMKSRYPDAGPITPRTLMTHHSGLPSGRFKGVYSRNPVPFTEMTDEIREDYALYPPNSVYSYSDVGIIVLGHMVEAASGRAFAEHMDESVLKPLGMSHSSFSPGPDIEAVLSNGYLGDVEHEQLPRRYVPSAGLYSNVLDLSRFIRMVFAGGRAGDRRILEPETLAEMLTPQNADLPFALDFRVGLGWILSPEPFMEGHLRDPEIAIARHGGSSLLFRATLVTLPEHKLGVVVLANSSASDGVIHPVAEAALALALEAKAGMAQPGPLDPPPQVSLTEAQRRRYTGHYATALGLFSVRSDGGRLITKMMGRTMQLVPRADGTVSLRYLLFGLIPLEIEMLEGIRLSTETVEGRKILVQHSLGKRFPLGARVEPGPIPGAWRARAGDYEVLNPDELNFIEKVSLREKEGLLVLDVLIPGADMAATDLSLAVSPISDTEAVIAGLGGRMPHIDGTLHAVIVDGEERLRYSGFELRKKLVERKP